MVVCCIQVAAGTDVAYSAEAVAVNLKCNVPCEKADISGYSYRIKCLCLGRYVSFIIQFSCLRKEYVTLVIEKAGIHPDTSFPVV